MKSKLLSIAALLPVVCHAESLPLLTHHARQAVLNGRAELVGHLSGGQHLRLTLVLPLRNPAGLDRLLRDLYNPASPSYRHFLTVDEFTANFGPAQEDYDTLIRFARANGLAVVATSRNRRNLDVTGSVANIEAALHLRMGVYQHPVEHRTFYAPDREPTLDLPFALWHIGGLDNYSIPKPAIKRTPAGVTPNAAGGSCPSGTYCGSDMRAAYYGGTLTGSGQSLGLVAFEGTDLTDLDNYYANAKQTNSVPITLLSTDGTPASCTYSQGCDDTEQTLDMTQALGMAPGLSSLVMYVGSVEEPIFNAMATANPLNAQLSCSWGWDPADPSSDDPYFEEFAAQGQNMFVAAGDQGSWQGSQTGVYPADDAYITSVGGTSLVTSSAGGPWSSEAGVAGGGGISPNNIPIPSWQTAAASGCSDCSQTLRNGPDVSANALGFYFCSDTRCYTYDGSGTSFSAPMWAGYLALVNEQYAAKNGGSSVGFINPALYTIGLGANYDTSFHDITSGNNGFPATTGYDLVTGWGSPNGAALINLLSNKSSQTITFATTAPASAAYNSSFTVAATASSGLPVTFTSSGACANSGATYTMTKATGTCSVVANQAGNWGYTAAPEASQSTTASKATPTVTFTGAPATAPYHRDFLVATSTNDGTTATITATGPCTYNNGYVTMTSGTGTCKLAAKWPATKQYLAASATQSTVATKLVPTITWATPAPITYGTALSSTQLDASCGTAGTLTYTPAAGAIPSGGNQTLKVRFTPTVTADYADTTASVTLVVNPVGTTTQVTSTVPASPKVGVAVAIHFSVTAGYGTPGGSVTVNAGTGESCNGTLTRGKGSCTITFAVPGGRTLTAHYGGASNDQSSTSAGYPLTVQ